MATQNITLSVPKEILMRVKVIAAQRGTSVSHLLVQALEEVVARDAAYERARDAHLAILRRPRKLGTGGRATWSRDDLHER